MHRVVLFTKLLIIMGVTSLTIPIHVLFGSKDPLSVYAIITRPIHFIPVFAILFIFGLNEKNLRLLRQKYPKLRGKTEIIDQNELAKL